MHIRVREYLRILEIRTIYRIHFSLLEFWNDCACVFVYNMALYFFYFSCKKNYS